ncbi:MAG: hypothetical protein ACLR8P_02065 [Clostridium fessum]
MWLPALVLIASILLLWQNAGENSHPPRPINSQCKFEDFYNPAQPYVSVNAPSLYYTGALPTMERKRPDIIITLWKMEPAISICSIRLPAIQSRPNAKHFH